jgi:hypothetical protein
MAQEMRAKVHLYNVRDLPIRGELFGNVLERTCKLFEKAGKTARQLGAS